MSYCLHMWILLKSGGVEYVVADVPLVDVNSYSLVTGIELAILSNTLSNTHGHFALLPTVQFAADREQVQTVLMADHRSTATARMGGWLCRIAEGTQSCSLPGNSS